MFGREAHALWLTQYYLFISKWIDFSFLYILSEVYTKPPNKAFEAMVAATTMPADLNKVGNVCKGGPEWTTNQNLSKRQCFHCDR